MKVKELISKLEACNPDAKVFVWAEAYEYGDRASDVYESDIAKNLHCKSLNASWDDDDSKNFIVIG